MSPETTDEMLVRSAQGGSRDASGELFDRHWRAVWRASYAIAHSHEVAEDCAQDAFMRAFGGLDSYRGPSFRAWVSRIAVNQTLNHLRKDRRVDPLGDDMSDPAGEATLPDAALERALADLSLERRAIIVLRYWLGYSPVEIAPLLDLPVGTVHSRLARALSQLRECLEVEDVERA
jgi:RNA polymerase sigma-70 factor, ECF subfamily